MKKFLATLLVLSVFSPLLALAQTGATVDGYSSYGSGTTPTAPAAGGFVSVPINDSSATTCSSTDCTDTMAPAINSTTPLYIPTGDPQLKPITNTSVTTTCSLAADTVQGLFKCSVLFVHYRIIPMLFVITFIIFVWNAFAYVREADSEVKRKDASKFFAWSVWIFFLTVSMWGIVAGLQRSFSISEAGLVNTTIRTDCPSQASGSITDIIQYATCTVVNMAIPALVILIITIFFWNVLQFVRKGDASDERKKANDYVMYSIFGFFILFSVWGFVSVLGRSFGITKVIPQFGTGDTTSVDKAAQFTGKTLKKIDQSQ